MINPYSKILIIRFSSFGDIILTFPLVKAIREKFPSAKIHFAANSRYAGLLQLNPYINKIISYTGDSLSKLKDTIDSEDYDVILDVHKNLKSCYITLFSDSDVRKYRKETLKKLMLVEFKFNYFKEIIPVFKKYMLTAADVLPEEQMNFSVTPLLFDKTRMFEEKYIVIAPSARHFTKTYPADKFIDFMKKIPGVKKVLVGDESNKDLTICAYIEKNTINPVNLCGKLNYEQLAGVLFNSEFVICNDSGILHFSEAVGKKVYSLFGCTVQEFGFFPQLKESVVIENHELPCRPCTHIGLPGCPKDHFKCMREIEIKLTKKDAETIT